MLTFALILAAAGLLAAGVVTGTVVLSGAALGPALAALALLLVPWARLRARVRRSAGHIPANEEAEKLPDGLAADADATTPAPVPDGARLGKPCAGLATDTEETLTGGTEPGGAETSGRSRTSERTATATPPAPAPADRAALVLVVPGRHRYHRESCPLLEGRDTQRLARDEAEEEGFTACTRCAGARSGEID